MPKIRISSDFWFRQRSIFPGSHPPSIFDAEELNFRVRDGNGWVLFAFVTEFLFSRGLCTLKTKQLTSNLDSLLSLTFFFLVKPSAY